MIKQNGNGYKATIKVFYQKKIILEDNNFEEIIKYIQDKKNPFDYVTIDNKDYIYSKEIQRKQVEELVNKIMNIKKEVVKKGLGNIKRKNIDTKNIKLEDLYIYALQLEKIEKEKYKRDYPVARNFIDFFEQLKRVKTFAGLSQKILDNMNYIILGLGYGRYGEPEEVRKYIDLLFEVLVKTLKKYKFIYLYLQPFKEVLYEINKYAKNLSESDKSNKQKIAKKTFELLKELKDIYLHYLENYPLWGVPEYFDYDRTLIGNLKVDIKSIVKRYSIELGFSTDDFYIKLGNRLIGRDWLKDLTRYDF